MPILVEKLSKKHEKFRKREKSCRKACFFLCQNTLKMALKTPKNMFYNIYF